MAENNETLDSLIFRLREFTRERDWEQFHNPKDLACAISIEASELLELFLWKETSQLADVDSERIKEELADVLIYCLLLADKCKLDPVELISQKMAKNALKYPIHSI